MTGAARLTRLRLHIQEVSDRLADWQSQSAAGMSGARFSLEKYLETLKAEMTDLEAALGESPSGTARTFLTRARPI